MNPLYHRAKFILSAPNLQTCPEDNGYEVAFAGRSNAGKSSAINTITNQKSLARISKLPGRTQQLVFFDLDEQRRIVDLPGYGFAKVPMKVQQKWQKELEYYLKNRQSLNGLVLLVDIRRLLGPHDIQLLEYAEHLNLEVCLVLTKSDKLSKNEAKKAFFSVQKEVSNISEHIQVELFSSLKKEGVDPVHHWLDQQLNVLT
ncbi:MAG: YihA family ribosome biogenesis GTP-binding protein [Cycloclasticus sp. symbiont of Poecilosclerida sp. M]|nr:MAG: YihA family ribosome biogenesis GTP-binding protein [Cycloclasticus sp. symbiont of Poecilosclerida sp. M]